MPLGVAATWSPCECARGCAASSCSRSDFNSFPRPVQRMGVSRGGTRPNLLPFAIRQPIYFRLPCFGYLGPAAHVRRHQNKQPPRLRNIGSQRGGCISAHMRAGARCCVRRFHKGRSRQAPAGRANGGSCHPAGADGLLFVLDEIILAYAADRAHPIFGNVLESGAGGNAAVGIAFGRIVYEAANLADVFVHWCCLLVSRVPRLFAELLPLF